jgi:hypothetical protein
VRNVEFCDERQMRGKELFQELFITVVIGSGIGVFNTSPKNSTNTFEYTQAAQVDEASFRSP